jgi:peptidoglycan/xylan/chitin deacetylase (PgdA/CDA1 family)
VEIKPFVYVAVAGVTIGLLVVAGGVVGNRRATDNAPVVAPMRSATHRATPTPARPAAPAKAPIQAVGIHPPRLRLGTGPYGSVITTGTDTMALTFDDGPSPDWTPKMLEVLRQAGVKATFCLVGTEVEAYPDLVKEIVADGHTICNHSWDHNLNLGSLAADAIQSDMQRTNDAIEAAAPGTPISYFRAPGGNWTATMVSVAADLGMSALDWAVDPRDWEVPPVDTIVSTIETSAQPGSIFLMHDGGGNRENSVEAVRQFLPALTANASFIPLPTGG